MSGTRPGPGNRRARRRVAVLVVVTIAWLATGAAVRSAAPAVARVAEGTDEPAGWRGHGADAVRYRWPVPGPVVRTWDPPVTRYAAGHRGVDLAVVTGERVVAMAAGVVGWSGVVAGIAWVSVDHADGIRTTVGPMATIAVRRGDRVVAGARLGTATGRAHATAGVTSGGGLHVSARRDGDYVDPATLVGDLVPTLLVPGDVRLGP
jgi:murein DD-endopeptidase MepM/ murein hydrolase activator NlpD